MHNKAKPELRGLLPPSYLNYGLAISIKQLQSVKFATIHIDRPVRRQPWKPRPQGSAAFIAGKHGSGKEQPEFAKDSPKLLTSPRNVRIDPSTHPVSHRNNLVALSYYSIARDESGLVCTAGQCSGACVVVPLISRLVPHQLRYLRGGCCSSLRVLRVRNGQVRRLQMVSWPSHRPFWLRWAQCMQPAWLQARCCTAFMAPSTSAHLSWPAGFFSVILDSEHGRLWHMLVIVMSRQVQSSVPSRYWSISRGFGPIPAVGAPCVFICVSSVTFIASKATQAWQKLLEH